MGKKNKKTIAGLIAFLLVAVMMIALTACSCNPEEQDVPEKKLTAITLDTSGAKTTFAYNEKFTAEGLKVTAKYDDDSTAAIGISDCKIAGYDTSLPGSQKVRVSYGGITERYDITVLERELPPLDQTPIVEIKGANAAAPYTVEAEKINMTKTGAKKADDKKDFVADPPDAAHTSHVTSGKYLTNYGVEGNYFGFTFTADKAYAKARDLSIGLRVANNTENVISLVDSLKMYLNYKTVAESGELSMEGKSLATSPVMKTVNKKLQATNEDGSPKVDANGNPVYVQATNEDGSPKVDADGNPVYEYEPETDENGNPKKDGNGNIIYKTEKVVDYYEEDNWTTILFRGNFDLKEGVNTLAFEVLSDAVPNIDYINFYVGNLASSSLVTIDKATEKGAPIVKEFEDFDLEKIKVRSDMVAAHGLKDGQAFIERPTSNLENTSGGKSSAANVQGTEITTQILVKDKATVRIRIANAAIGDYRVKDNWEFWLDDKQLVDVEDVNIKAGSSDDGTYWEWRDTTVGVLDLEAGNYLFTVKVVGGDCNTDCFKFDVFSYGKFAAPQTLDKIEVTAAPTKTEYYQSEDFDPAGMVITATYLDGTTEDVTENVTFDKRTNLLAGDKITATYEDASCELPVTVKAATEVLLTENKTYTVEAEWLDRAGVISRKDMGVARGTVKLAKHDAVSNGIIVEGFAGTNNDAMHYDDDIGKGTVWTIKLKTNGAANVKFGIKMAAGGALASEKVAFVFNDEALTPTSETDRLPQGTGDNPYYNCGSVDLGSVQVAAAGEYTFKVNVINDFNFDCLTFEVSGIA